MTGKETRKGKLAIYGGSPVRSDTLPYGRQYIDDSDIDAVVDVLKSDWLTTGPKVAQFEEMFGKLAMAKHSVAVSSGTAALHAAMFAIGIGPGDEVIVPTLTFAASANCVVYQGGTPIFADVEQGTLLLNPQEVEKHLSSRTKAIIAVDYAGQACDYSRLHEIAEKYGLIIVADACHAIGGSYKGSPVGSLADLSTFSFHPVKHMTTAEGGMVTTDRDDWAAKMMQFRNHGITSDHRQREQEGSWFYEMNELGYNYRISDIQCSLGMSQLSKLHRSVERRRQIAAIYDQQLADIEGVTPLVIRPDAFHAYHLYVVRIDHRTLGIDRGQVFKALRAEGSGVNVHYVPVHLHPYYQRRFETGLSDCPVAEAAYSEILSLPIFPTMTDQDASDVLVALRKVCDQKNWS